jgi:hydrogenase/urease accessory protein HupE
MRGNKRLRMEPVFPDDCHVTGQRTHFEDGVASSRRWTMQCKQGLSGREIAIDGLSATLTDVLVRIENQDGTIHSDRLTFSEPRTRLAETAGLMAIAKNYMSLGIEHILLGIDHLLFVLGLLLIVRGHWLLVKTITAFTVAHSITLALATLSLVQVPQAPVEAVIALSIVFLATEIARPKREALNLAFRFPWIVAFIFGLLHGFGFAGALSEVGLPQTDIPLALLFFNVGVEAGQLLFVGAYLALGWVFSKIVHTVPSWITPATAYAIGGVSSYWMIARVVAMFRLV